MNKIDRRQKLALDEAYRLFRRINRDEHAPDIYQIVRCLKTVVNALKSAQDGQLKLTIRLWLRIEQALFDRLLTSYPAYLVIYDTEGTVLPAKAPIPENAVIEVHPEGLKRADDAFQMCFENLHPTTQGSLAKTWVEKGPYTKREDFANFNCDDACPSRLFILGDEVLRGESENGKQRAYKQWWDLYWQAYCTNNPRERNDVLRQMQSIEAVWGNLYY